MQFKCCQDLIVNGPAVIAHDQTCYNPFELGTPMQPKTVTTYRFRNNSGRGCRYSIYVERFVTSAGVRPVLEWFATMDEAIQAADEMKADGRFYGIHSYMRSQATADTEFKF